MSAEEKEREYWEAKREFEELDHAKRVSDQILWTMFGIHPGPDRDFPGLKESYEEKGRKLDEWSEAYQQEKHGEKT